MQHPSLDKINSILDYVKSSFIGKDEIIDLLGITLLARENMFLFGPPGTAKSAIVRQFNTCIEGGKNFEYLLTRFTEPNELFGPFDIRKLKEGELVTNTEGMLPEASLVFLDEIFNANSAILNSLLMALNERLFRRGKETRTLPALMFIGASNALPDDEALNALLDRFLVRVRCENVDTDLLETVLLKGWVLGHKTEQQPPMIAPSEIIELQHLVRKVNLEPILKNYITLVHAMRNTGVKVSDRRAVKLQNLIAASAVICGRDQAINSDLWILKYIWDNEEQIEILAGMVDAIVSKETEPQAHPQTVRNQVPRAEEIAKDLHLLSQQLMQPQLSFEELSILKDKLHYLQSRCAWIHHKDQQAILQTEISALWEKVLQTN